MKETELKTIAIIQARRAASRLPDKVLLDIAGEPMLVRVVERARRAKTLDGVVVATTTDAFDDAIEALCQQRGYALSRGSMYDVLDRYYQAARLYQADIIVRITADCPVVDPALIDETILTFLGEGAARGPFDFAASRLPPPFTRTYPIGQDIEVCHFGGLERAWREAKQNYQREHVMPYFYDHQERFKILLVHHETDHGTLRLTVDTADDLDLIRQIFARFPGRDDFSWLEVLSLLKRQPELLAINAQVQHKHYRQVDERRNGAD